MPLFLVYNVKHEILQETKDTAREITDGAVGTDQGTRMVEHYAWYTRYSNEHLSSMNWLARWYRLLTSK